VNQPLRASHPDCCNRRARIWPNPGFIRRFAVQLGGAAVANSAAPPLRGVLVAGAVVALVTVTFVYASVHRFEPHSRGSPVAAAL